MKARWMLIMVVALAFSLVGGATTAWANSDDQRITLTGSAAFPNAKGTAKYRDRGGEREFQVEVENVRRLAGRTLSVFVNGNKVGSMTVNTLGEARFNRNTDLGQRVPVIRSGSRVQVKTAAGRLVVSGIFP